MNCKNKRSNYKSYFLEKDRVKEEREKQALGSINV